MNSTIPLLSVGADSNFHCFTASMAALTKSGMSADRLRTLHRSVGCHHDGQFYRAGDIHAARDCRDRRAATLSLGLAGQFVGLRFVLGQGQPSAKLRHAHCRHPKGQNHANYPRLHRRQAHSSLLGEGKFPMSSSAMPMPARTGAFGKANSIDAKLLNLVCLSLAKRSVRERSNSKHENRLIDRSSSQFETRQIGSLSGCHHLGTRPLIPLTQIEIAV